MIFFLVFLFFTSFSPAESDKTFSGISETDFGLYNCRYIDKISGELRTTCENIRFLSGKPVIYNGLNTRN